MSGPSIMGPSRAAAISSAVYGSTSGLPLCDWCSFQPSMPLKTRTDVLSRTWTSKRALFGRACCSTNGTRGIDGLPVSRRPIETMVSILRQASSPPRALTFFATICLAVKWGTPGAGAAATAHETARPRIRQAARASWHMCIASFHDQAGHADRADHHVNHIAGLDDFVAIAEYHRIL